MVFFDTIHTLATSTENIMKKIFTFFLTTIISISLLVPVTCYASSNSRRIVKVCHFPLETFSSGHEKHAYHDYYSDYLLELGQQTGWIYEYVDASFDDCMEMIANQ